MLAHRIAEKLDKLFANNNFTQSAKNIRYIWSIAKFM